MKRMTLREAAELSARSITTLRRYIRSGRLEAEKVPGRFGPEYFVSTAALIEARLPVDGSPAVEPPAQPRPAPAALARRADVTAPSGGNAGSGVPLTLFTELQMKHEQLLVQYGMVRAAGLRMLELRAELESQRRRGAERERELAALRRDAGGQSATLEKELRRAHLELEGRALEIAALREKVRTLEMLARNAETSDGIDRRYGEAMHRAARIERLVAPERLTPAPADH